MPGLCEHLPQPLDRVELGGLRRRLERDADAVRSAHVAHLADGGRPRESPSPCRAGSSRSRRRAPGPSGRTRSSPPGAARRSAPSPNIQPELAADAGHGRPLRRTRSRHRLGGLMPVSAARAKSIRRSSTAGHPASRAIRSASGSGVESSVQVWRARDGRAAARGSEQTGLSAPLRCANASGLTTWSCSPFRWAAIVAMAMFSMLRAGLVRVVADVRRDQRVGQVAEHVGARGHGLLVVDVERRAGDPPGPQELGQRRVVHDLRARRVHEVGRPGFIRDRRARETRCSVSGRSERWIETTSERLNTSSSGTRTRPCFGAVRRRVPGPAHQLHPHARAEPGHLPADRAEADQAERLAPELACPGTARAPSGPP